MYIDEQDWKVLYSTEEICNWQYVSVQYISYTREHTPSELKEIRNQLVSAQKFSLHVTFAHSPPPPLHPEKTSFI
jgi:hypothetical protein